MWMMVQQPRPDDYVVATGEMHTVREFVQKAFTALDITVRWEGEGEQSCGIDAASGKTIVRVDPRYYRPSEVEQLLGNPAKAKAQLGWEPEVKFEQLVELMVKADWDALK
jgi:GDPmannose 4,6-dehydratase